MSENFNLVLIINVCDILQYYSVTGLPGKRLDPNVCGVCGNPIIVLENEEGFIEDTFKLGCNHMYPL